MNKLDDEVEIFHIDEEQKNIIIRLDNIRKLLDRNNKLQDEVNQLETNRDEALKEIEQVIKMIEDGRSKEQFLPYLKNQKKILERGE